MKVLFVNPPPENTILEQTSKKEEDSRFMEVEELGSYPPLGLLYVASFLEKKSPQHEIHFIDCVGERIDHEILKQRMKELQPDVVGVTSFTISLIDVVKVARQAKEVSPNCHTVMGGHHPIAFPYEAAQLPEFDSIVVGEGEFAFNDLVNFLEEGKDIEQIHGVYTKRKIEVFRSKENRLNDRRFLSKVMVPPAYIDNLDDLPVPNRNMIKHIPYRNPVGGGGRLATIITTRGCPYKCTYCDVPYKKYRKRDTKDVLDEVQACLDMGYEEVHFYDDLFNITAKKVIDFCDAIEERGIQFTWDFRGRVNSVTRESIVRAKRAGCRMMSFGVETGTDHGLEYIKKQTTTEKAREVFKWCRELGVYTVADFMLGFPFEKEEKDVIESIDFLIDIDPDYCLIAILMLLPNTEIYDEAVQKGLIDPQTWVDFALDPEGNPDFRIDFWTEHLNVDQLERLRHQSYKRFYLRPKYILREALRIRNWQTLKNRIYGFLIMIKDPDRKNLWAKKFNVNIHKAATETFLYKGKIKGA